MQDPKGEESSWNVFNSEIAARRQQSKTYLHVICVFRLSLIVVFVVITQVKQTLICWRLFFVDLVHYRLFVSFLVFFIPIHVFCLLSFLGLLKS